MQPPQTEPKQEVRTWIPGQMARELRQLARDNCRSTSGELRLALRRHLAEQQKDRT
jgi:hypothetical protein